MHSISCVFLLCHKQMCAHDVCHINTVILPVYMEVLFINALFVCFYISQSLTLHRLFNLISRNIVNSIPPSYSKPVHKIKYDANSATTYGVQIIPSFCCVISHCSKFRNMWFCLHTDSFFSSNYLAFYVGSKNSSLA